MPRQTRLLFYILLHVLLSADDTVSDKGGTYPIGAAIFYDLTFTLFFSLFWSFLAHPDDFTTIRVGFPGIPTVA